MPRVLLLIHKLWNGGGTETYVLTLANELKGLGCQVGVFTSGGPWVSHFRRQGVRVHVHSSRATALRELRQVIASYGYHAIHAHDGESFRLAKLLRRTQRLRTVFTVHGRYVSSRVLSNCATAANVVTAVSPAVRNYIVHCGVPAHKVQIVHNGVSTHLFRPSRSRALRRLHGISDGTFVIGYAGRFTFDKVGLSKRICAVLRSYTHSHPNSHLLVAGRNSRTHVAPSRNCTVLGQVSNMPHFYNACDLVVGTARVALESLACGVPTVAVGYYRYLGLVTISNIQRAQRSNFGDHGVRKHPWLNRQLFQEVGHVHRHRDTYASAAQSLSTWVSAHDSARSMARKMMQLYR